MKALEARFFNTVGSSQTTAPKQIHCGFHSWCIANTLTPAMGDGEFAWINGNEGFLVGTREQYLEWLGNQSEVPNWIGDYDFHPFGLFCAKVNGRIYHCRCVLGGSSYCAHEGDFYPLLWALEGLPSLNNKGEIDYEVESNRLGTGIYQCFSKRFGVRPPSYWVHEVDRNQEEQNFLQKYL